MAKTPTAPSFGSILERAPTEVERPKPLPQGSYITTIVGQPRYDKSSKKQTEFVEFTHKFVSADDDVDADELKVYLGDDKKLSDVTLKNTYYLTEGSVYRLDEFHEHCGIELDPKVSRRERNEQTPGAQIGVYIAHEPSQDGSTFFARINKTFVVE